MEKCPKCLQNTLAELPGAGSAILGKAKKCTNPNCTYSELPETEGLSLSAILNKGKKKDEEEE